MKAVIAIIRLLAVLLGLLWIASSTMDLLGLLPYSTAVPPLWHRALHSIPLLYMGAGLIVPYRRVPPGLARAVVGILLCLGVGWVLYTSFDGIVDYRAGAKSWHVLPLVVAFPALTLANLWAFLRLTGRSSGGA